MTPEQLKEIKEAHADDSRGNVWTQQTADECHTHRGLLLAEVERLRKENAKLSKPLQLIPRQPSCGGWDMSDMKPVKPENPNFKCRKCGSDDVWYERVDDDFGHEDLRYECHGCNRSWYVDGIDS